MSAMGIIGIVVFLIGSFLTVIAFGRFVRTSLRDKDIQDFDPPDTLP